MVYVELNEIGEVFDPRGHEEEFRDVLVDIDLGFKVSMTHKSRKN